MNPIRSLRHRALGWLGLRWLLTGIAVVALTVLGLLVADAAMDLPESLRAAIPAGLALAAVALLGRAAREWRATTPMHVATALERRHPRLGSRLSNAVAFSTQESQTAVEEVFRREAVELGARAAAGLSTARLSARGLRVATAAAVAGILAVLLFRLAAPDAWHEILPRYLDPHGDHPPFSRLKIRVTPLGGEVTYGGNIEIRATTVGRPVEKLFLVSRAGTNLTRTVMFAGANREFFQTLANVREDSEYYVTDGLARSHRHPLHVLYAPQILRVDLGLVFPAYTGLPPRTNRLGDEPLALPADTRLHFRVASNRPLKAGGLTLTPVLGGKARTVALSVVASPTLVAGEFTLQEGVSFALSIRDIDGLESQEPRRGRVTVLPDQRPTLHVLEPGRDAVATPDVRIPVRVQAEDDYGVSRVTWLRGFNRSVERPIALPLTVRETARSVAGEGTFDLAGLGVNPGDLIEYYFEAADNDPKGPNVTVSRVFRLEIISRAQYEEVLRRQVARKALFEPYLRMGAWMARLVERARTAEKQAKAARSPEEVSAAHAAVQDLARELERYGKDLDDLLGSAPMFDVEAEFRETLEELRAGAGAARILADGAARKTRPDPDQLAALRTQLERYTDREQQKVSDPARELASVARLLARANGFVRLARQQATLAQMLRRFQDHTGGLSRLEQVEVDELLEQERRLRDGLKTYLESLPGLVAEIPQDAAYEPMRKDIAGFLQAVKELKIETLVEDAVGALSQKDHDTRAVLAQRAAEQMDRLISKCSGMEQQGQQCLRFRPQMPKSSGQSLRQILEAMGGSQGQGGSTDGYSLFNEDVGLYGPNAERVAAAQPSDRQGASGNGPSPGGRGGLAAAASPEPVPVPGGATAHIRLQPDARVPLRYRDVVGDYFRAVADAEANPK